MSYDSFRFDDAPVGKQSRSDGTAENTPAINDNGKFRYPIDQELEASLAPSATSNNVIAEKAYGGYLVERVVDDVRVISFVCRDLSENKERALRSRVNKMSAMGCGGFTIPTFTTFVEHSGNMTVFNFNAGHIITLRQVIKKFPEENGNVAVKDHIRPLLKILRQHQSLQRGGEYISLNLSLDNVFITRDRRLLVLPLIDMSKDEEDINKGTKEDDLLACTLIAIQQFTNLNLNAPPHDVDPEILRATSVVPGYRPTLSDLELALFGNNVRDDGPATSSVRIPEEKFSCSIPRRRRQESDDHYHHDGHERERERGYDRYQHEGRDDRYQHEGRDDRYQHEGRDDRYQHEGRDDRYQHEDRNNRYQHEDRNNRYQHEGRDDRYHHEGRDDRYHHEGRNDRYHHEGRNDRYQEQNRNDRAYDDDDRHYDDYDDYHDNHDVSYDSNFRRTPAEDKKHFRFKNTGKNFVNTLVSGSKQVFNKLKFETKEERTGTLRIRNAQRNSHHNKAEDKNFNDDDYYTL